MISKKTNALVLYRVWQICLQGDTAINNEEADERTEHSFTSIWGEKRWRDGDAIEQTDSLYMRGLKKIE